MEQYTMPDGSKRNVRGKLKGVSAPVGAILGPTDITREYLVALGPVLTKMSNVARLNRGGGTLVGYASKDDFDSSQVAILAEGPRTVAEHVRLVHVQCKLQGFNPGIFGPLVRA